jgi:UPF0716 protein FxsA
MVGALFLLLLVVPVIELWIILQVSKGLGLGTTLVLLVLISVAGAWLLKQQGVQTWRRLRTTLSRGQIPADEVTDGALILLGGALLMTPGFATDATGLLLLLPPSRAVVKRVARKGLGWWVGERLGGHRRPPTGGEPARPNSRGRRPRVIEATEVHPAPTPPDGDDSRDRG